MPNIRGGGRIKCTCEEISRFVKIGGREGGGELSHLLLIIT